MPGIELQDIPRDSRVRDHGILRDKWNGSIALSLDISTLSVENSIGPGWRRRR